MMEQISASLKNQTRPHKYRNKGAWHDRGCRPKLCDMLVTAGDTNTKRGNQRVSLGRLGIKCNKLDQRYDDGIILMTIITMMMIVMMMIIMMMITSARSRLPFLRHSHPAVLKEKASKRVSCVLSCETIHLHTKLVWICLPNVPYYKSFQLPFE